MENPSILGSYVTGVLIVKRRLRDGGDEIKIKAFHPEKV